MVAVTEIAKQFTTTEMIKTKLRDYSKQTSLWYVPLEEENVGLGAMHEVTCDSYKLPTSTSHGRRNGGYQFTVSNTKMVNRLPVTLEVRLDAPNLTNLSH